MLALFRSLHRRLEPKQLQSGTCTLNSRVADEVNGLINDLGSRLTVCQGNLFEAIDLSLHYVVFAPCPGVQSRKMLQELRKALQTRVAST